MSEWKEGSYDACEEHANTSWEECLPCDIRALRTQRDELRVENEALTKDRYVCEAEHWDRALGGGPCSCGHDRYAHLHDDGESDMPFLGSCHACRYRCKQYDGTVSPDTGGSE